MTIARGQNSHPLRRLAVLLGVMAILVRCVIAPGLMPDPVAAAQGTFKLVICTGAGLKTLPHAPGDPAPVDPHHDGALCPYTSIGHVALGVDDWVPAPHGTERGFETPSQRWVVLGTALRLDGARAPPRIG